MLVSLYKNFHANPELSFMEVETAKRLAAELGLELIRLMSDDGEAPGRNGAADGEGELHGVLQLPAAEVDRLFPGVVQLDKFDLLNFDIWVEVYFIDNHSPRSQFSNTQ